MTTKSSSYSFLILCFSLIGQLGPFVVSLRLPVNVHAQHPAQCSVLLPKHGNCEEIILFSQPLLSEKDLQTS